MSAFVIDNAWMVFALPIAIGLVGFFTSGEIVDVRTGEKTSVRIPTFVLWMWGSFLILAVVFIGAIFLAAANCGQLNADGDALSLTPCDQPIQGWYGVLKDWQTAVGAILGLFGIAWTSFFRSIYGTA
ncbi:MAG: hypothetical protein AAGE18_19395 [Pseudomonadota bacterium]